MQRAPAANEVTIYMALEADAASLISSGLCNTLVHMWLDRG
jgi:hypothetical protein